MPPPLCRFLLLLCLWLAAAGPVGAAGWRFRSGEELSGEPVAWDPARRILTFRDPVSGHESLVPSRNLSLRSKQRLLLSPRLRLGGGEGGPWTAEKSRALLLLFGAPAALLLLGFWAAAGYVTRRWHPGAAFVGFVGGWAVVGILGICYAFLAHRLEGGDGLFAFGAAVAVASAALYVSAVYACSFGKALIVFASHLLAGFLLLCIVLAAFEIGAGKRRSERWWDERIFEPFGLIAPEAPRRGT